MIARTQTRKKTDRWLDVKPGLHSNAIACVANLRALRKRKPQETQALALATMIGCLPTQALAFLAGFVYATRTQRTQRKRLRLNGNRALAGN